MTTNFDNTKINELLLMQKNELAKLASLLNHEFDVLKERDLITLEQKAQEKELLLNNINQLDQALSQQIPPEELNKHEQFTDQVKAITGLLTECKKQNEINGQIINNSQVAINRFKGMLQQSISNNSMTYDSKGKTSINTHSIGIKA